MTKELNTLLATLDPVEERHYALLLPVPTGLGETDLPFDQSLDVVPVSHVHGAKRVQALIS